MRTFPKSLALFRELVDQRGQQLRKLSLEELERLGTKPVEHLIVESRPATIGVIVRQLTEGGLRVVVQGFMKARFMGRNVALDGFYKQPDGTVTAMNDEEFYEFD